jgi:Holliday junction DNA helicase RuvA
MIGKLRGLLDSRLPDGAVVDVGGVGYQLFCSQATLAALPDEGEPCQLWVETHVREDHIHLFGFASDEERQWFRLLTTVQGVGVRMALEVLSALTISEIITAIAAGDASRLTRAKGVGAKLAARLVTELKGKAPNVTAAVVAAFAPAARKAPVGGQGVYEDALSALVNLGYGRSEAFSALGQVRGDAAEDAKLDQIIPRALKVLSA